MSCFQGYYISISLVTNGSSIFDSISGIYYSCCFSGLSQLLTFSCFLILFQFGGFPSFKKLGSHAAV